MPISPYKLIFDLKAKEYTFYDTREVTFFEYGVSDCEFQYTGFDFDILEHKIIGSLPIEIANLSKKIIFEKISYPVFGDIYKRIVCPEKAYEYLNEYFSKEISLGFLNKIYDLKLGEEETSINKSYSFYFSNWIDTLLYSAQNFCNDYCSSGQLYLFDNKPRKIELYITFENNLFNSRYAVTDLRDLIYFEIGKIVENKVQIKKCQNCGKYFIPNKRSNEIYCDNIFDDTGKTCRNIGYVQKLKNDSFKTAYRSAYKTQRARIKYHAEELDYEEKHFKPWEFAAKEAMELYSSTNDVNGFKQWLVEYRDKF